MSEHDPVYLHRDYLIECVKEAIKLHPEKKLVGYVLEKDAPEIMSILQSPAEINRAEDGSIALVLTRESAKRLLAAFSPQVLEWLENNEPGVLPVIQSAKRGMRAGVLRYDAAY